MPRKPRPPRRPRGPGPKRHSPRFDRSLPRSGRIPLCLIDGTNAATIAADLNVFARAIHSDRPCWSQILTRYAEQVENGYTAAAAVAAMTDTPNGSADVTEGVLAEGVLAEGVASDGVPIEPGA